jgi:hypothetical protein
MKQRPAMLKRQMQPNREKSFMEAVVTRWTRVARAGALTAGALTVALLGTAPAQAITAGSSAAAAAPCRKVASANSDTVRLWYCNGTGGTARGYHGQALLSSSTNISLRSSTGKIMAITTAGNTGVLDRWFNTRTYAGSGLFRACTGYRGTTGTCTKLAR